MSGTFADTSNAYSEPDDIGEERARELYQYYRPPREGKNESNPLPYPDSVLQAHAQLAAIRLDVKRAIIGLVDKDTSYFVAEATRSLDLEDNNQFEHGDDEL